MKRAILALAVLVLAFVSSACKTTGDAPSTFCQWVYTAEIACDTLQPIPTPPPAVAAEIRAASEASPGTPIGTACTWVRIAAAACRNNQPIPPAPANVARSFSHDDSR